MALSQSQAYLSMQVKTSDRMEILVSLYEALLGAVTQAMEAAEAGDAARRGDKIEKASEVLLTLCESLDYSQPGGLSGSLFALYNFYLQQLLEANRSGSLVPLQSARSGITILLDGWKQIANSDEARDIRLADTERRRKAPSSEAAFSGSASLALTA